MVSSVKSQSHDELLLSEVILGLDVLPQLHSLEEVFGIVRLSGLGHVLLDSEVENGDEEVEV